MSYTLKAWGDFKNYQNTCYRNYLFASEGLRVMGSTWSVLAPLKGLGEDVYLIGGEPHVLAHLKDQLRLKTNLGYRIEVHPYGSLPRYELKAKRFKDQRKKDT